MNTYFYHIYLTGNNHQDIFYSDYDFIQIINRMAIAALEKETEIHAYIFHQNHFHIIAKAADISKFMHHFRVSITRYFQKEYDIKGSIGSRRYGKYLIKDEDDFKDLVKYTLRNEVRHKLSPDPHSAKWSSFAHYFTPTKEERKNLPDKSITSPDTQAKYLPQRKDLPDNFKMQQSGLIHPATFLETNYIEELFLNKTNFIKEIYTKSYREIVIEEKEAVDKTQNNNTHKTSPQNNRIYVPISDLELIEYSFLYLKAKHSNKNILQLKLEEKIDLAKHIKLKYNNVSYIQLARILSIPKTVLWREMRK